MKKLFPWPLAQVAGWVAGGTILIVGTIAACMAGCTSSSAGGGGTPALTPRSYHGSASVGDFLNITVTPSGATAGTITYTDLSNNETGSEIPYTVNIDGSYAISDPAGNLISAWEIPGYALLIHANKVGPGQNTQALVTAVESGPITLQSLSGSYNYMNFRTQNGGMEIGSVALNASAQSVVISGYSPYVAYSGQAAGGFSGMHASTAGIVESSDGTYLSSTETEPDGSTDTEYLFGTAGGYFIVDNPNGTIIGLPQASTSAFTSGYAGSYSGIFYQKTNAAATGNNGTETGTLVLDPVSVSVGSSGAFTMTDITTGSQIVTGTLTPVAGTGYLYNGTSSELANPCNGMFTFRLTANGVEQDVFATFISANGKNSVLFSSFWAPTGQTGTTGYNYFYGIGLMGS